MNIRARLTRAATFGMMLFASVGHAQVNINWQSVNGGGGTVSNANYRLSSSIGQSTAGFVQNTSHLHWVGFWAGSIPNPTVVATAAEAKLLPDGTLVSLAGMIASSSTSDFTNMNGSFFYIQTPERSSGIRVSVPVAQVAGLVRGSVVNIMGTLGTTATGERQIEGPLVILASTTVPPVPLTMTNRSVGGETFGNPPNGQVGVAFPYGLNNVGLLVRSVGKVIAQEGNFVVIDDGSGFPSDPASYLRIDRTHLAAPPAIGSTVVVVGVTSLYKPAGQPIRMIIPRTTSDVTAP